MKSSLRDQLLKAGFVDKKKARQAEMEGKRKSKQERKARKSGQQIGPTAGELAAEKAKQEREMHAQRSRELNRAREEELARKAARAEVNQLLEREAQPHGKGEIRYHFMEAKKIKRLYVDQTQQTALANGRLAIVTWEGRHHLAPVDVAEKIKERIPTTFVFVAEPEVVDPDDPYADYPIPDDLEW
jgi:uncharacterized protein YaiL (DUF2058 family)